jgi:nucleoside-diphosphate-sugar epimerase
LDAAAVGQALDGCDAALHAAAVFSFDTREVERIRATNVRASEIVLGEAARLRLDPIVFVSSTVALLRSDGVTATAEDEPTDASGPYIASKAASELVARRLQAEGAPVVCVYPGEVFGPHDPHFGSNTRQLRDMLRLLYPIWTRGGVHVVDVRDVAEVIAASLESGCGPRRYIVPGHYLVDRELHRALAEVTGRRIPSALVPPWVLTGLVRPLDALQRRLPFHIPAGGEGAHTLVCATRFDDSPARDELGVQPRTPHDTLADTVRWLAESGHISRRLAGKPVR